MPRTASPLPSRTMPKGLPGAFLRLALFGALLAVLCPALRAGFPPFAKPARAATVEEPAMVEHRIERGPVTVITRAAADREASWQHPPQVRVLFHGREVAAHVFHEGIGAARVSFAEMDPGNPAPEVIAQAYSGGAHCCESIVVFSAPPGGSGPWLRHDLGAHDGGPRQARDLDGDGLAELPLQDDRFLYKFGCYACSLAPPRILSVRYGKVADLTRMPSMRPFLLRREKEAMKMLREDMAENRGRATSGLLAGYVALKMLLGEGPQGWRFMLKHHRRKARATLCPLPEKGGLSCGVPRIAISFPVALAFFLQQTGYAAPTVFPQE